MRRTKWPKGTYMKLISAALLVQLMDDSRPGNCPSQAELARFAGRSRQFINALRNGRKSTCTPQVAEAIAERLQVPVTLIFEPRKSNVVRPSGSPRSAVA